MYKLAAISPRTNSFIDVAPGETSPELQQFEQLLSEMAHATLGAKSPQLAEAIMHFKVLDSNMDENSGVGVFICKLGSRSIHVPVLLTQGSIKSPDVFYSPESDSYYPLNTKWISKFKNEEESALGVPADTTKMEFTPSSLGQVTSPPTARNKFSSYDIPVIASRVPNMVKKAMSSYLAKNRGILEKTVKYHGSGILKALAPSSIKTSAPKKRSWAILDSNAPADKFREIFGNQSKVAFSQALTHGFAYVDFRKNAGVLIKKAAEVPTSLSEPKESGVYKILRGDGTHVLSLIISNPTPIDEESQFSTYKYLIILENGDYICSDKMIALPSAESLDSDSQMYKRLENSRISSGLQALVNYKDGVLYNSTAPVELKNVTKRKDGVTTAKVGGKTIVFTASASTSSIVQPEGESVIFVPSNYSSLTLRNKLDADAYVTDPSHGLSLINQGVTKEASRKVKLFKNTTGDWVINGQAVPGVKEALFKLASIGCDLTSAVDAVYKYGDGYTHSFNVVPKGRLHKLASIFGPAAAPAQEEVVQPELPPDMSQQQQQQQPQMDPNTGEPMDPTTGLPIDPESGMPYNPETGFLVDVNTGQEIDPETGEPAPTPEEQALMEQASRANDQLAMDSALAATLLSSANMPELVTEYMPKLKGSLDALNRILLTIQLKQSDISEKIGLDEFARLETSLRKVSQGLGDIILRLESSGSVFREDPYGESA